MRLIVTNLNAIFVGLYNKVQFFQKLTFDCCQLPCSTIVEKYLRDDLEVGTVTLRCSKMYILLTP